MATPAQLTEARAAYHRLVIGQGTVEARNADGRMVKWEKADLKALQSYINQLEAALGEPVTNWTPFARTPARRVMF